MFNSLLQSARSLMSTTTTEDGTIADTDATTTSDDTKRDTTVDNTDTTTGRRSSDTSSTDTSLSISPPPGFLFACTLDTLPVNQRRCLSLNNRAVVVYRHKAQRTTARSPLCPTHYTNIIPHDGSELFTLDAICYHMGGPLVDAPIEELASDTVVVCPWHHYRISVRSGEGLYQALDKRWKSKGVKQRTHPTVVVDGAVYVRVEGRVGPPGTEGRVDSDLYCDRGMTVEEVEAKEKQRQERGEVVRHRVPSGQQREGGLNRGTRF